MKYKDFKTWVFNEKSDIYGFDSDLDEKEILPINDLPIKPILSNKIMEELNRHDLGLRKPKWDWSNLVEWGMGQTGDIHVELSPLGSYKAFVRRKIFDLEGTPTWICKSIHRIKETEQDRNEQNMAVQLMDELEKINDQLVEMPSHDFQEFPRLVESLTRKLIISNPKYMRYGGLVKNNENHFTLVMNPNGYGVEAPGGRRLEEFLIEMVYYPVAGIIRSWAYNVGSSNKGHKWEIEPSEWDEKFCPSQPIEEITEALVNAFYAY